MNGKSKAHQAVPSNGTQNSWLFRKKRNNGTRRFSAACSTGMSTQVW
jgi:hypothetical protein